MACGAAFPAVAADDSGMDSIWLDAPQPAPAGELPNPSGTSTTTQSAAPVKPAKPSAQPKPVLKPAPAIAPAEPELSAEPGIKPAAAPGAGQTPPNTIAPMVTLDYFKGSQLVTKGGWPGVGPFTEQASPLDMSDTNGNRLKVDVAGTQVTRAELNLQKSNGDFLDVQMNADFLLESVGVKPKKIVEFNEQLEKNRALVTKGNGMPNMTVGRYFVAIQKQPADSYNISVNSLDADRTALQEHSVTETTPPTKPSTLSTLFGGNKTSSAQPTTGGAKPAQTPIKKTTPTGSATSSKGSTTSSASSNAGADSSSKETFATLIRNWQNLKKTAVRQKQTGELSQLLAGRALDRQSKAIGWLVSNKKYYDITPKSVIVEKSTAVLPDKKYIVQTVIKEQSKLCDDGGQVVQDKEDTYKVNYTVEKIGDRWFIVDSALSTSAPPKAQAGGKPTR